MKIIIGLGNPTSEYEHTRHNIGRDIVEKFRKENKFPDWEFNKKANALISDGKIGKEKVMLILPETFMNDSGKSVAYYVKNKKQAVETIVIYDDLDLGTGVMKIAFNKGSGGHKGLESVIKKLKTREFPRLRLGIAPITPSGKVKKIEAGEKVVKHVLGKFKPSEDLTIKKVLKNSTKALEIFVKEGHAKAMNQVNGW